MSSTFTYFSAFIHGPILLDSESPPTTQFNYSRLKRYIATLPVPNFSSSSDLPTISDNIECETMKASVSAFFLPNTDFATVGEVLYVAAKFIALPDERLILDTTLHQVLAIDSSIPNPPDPMPCTVHVCGQVESVHNNLSQYGEYRGFDVHTATWTKESNRVVDFRIRILVSKVSKRFTNSLLPPKGVTINVHGVVCGRDSSNKYLIVVAKEFTKLPSSTAEITSPAVTPQKKSWGRPNPTTPSASKLILSPSAAESDPTNTPSKRKRKRSTTAPEIVPLDDSESVDPSTESQTAEAPSSSPIGADDDEEDEPPVSKRGRKITKTLKAKK